MFLGTAMSAEIQQSIPISSDLQIMQDVTDELAIDLHDPGRYVLEIAEAPKSRAEVVDLALKEVHEFFPAARQAQLLKSTVIKELHATYSPRPGIDAYRPQQSTAWPRVFLAGDWTATGWPATMEGAVRSGYLAAEALIRSTGAKAPGFLVPDLSATGFMRLFS